MAKRQKIKLKSTESPFHYYTTKNTTNTAERLLLKKYDPTIRKRVDFKETK